MQFNNIDNAYDISQWAVGKIKYKVSRKFNIGYMYVETLEGTMTASLGDYIVKGVNGEFYPVKPEIFEKHMRCWGSESYILRFNRNVHNFIIISISRYRSKR